MDSNRYPTYYDLTPTRSVCQLKFNKHLVNIPLISFSRVWNVLIIIEGVPAVKVMVQYKYIHCHDAQAQAPINAMSESKKPDKVIFCFRNISAYQH